jgi:hypothetical protein
MAFRNDFGLGWLVFASVVASAALSCSANPNPAAGAGGNGQGGGTAGQGGDGQGGTGQAGGPVVPYPPVDAFDPKYDAYFDPPAATAFEDNYRVVGETTPPTWSWGKIELLEGMQRYRSEGYNLRTQKLRFQDTFEDATYKLRTYFGGLNQQLVDGFNVFYKDACAGTAGQMGAPACGQTGPQRPEARFVLLHHGPKTASLTCDKTKTPVLLVHGAMQNGNVWIAPNGNDGTGNVYPGTTQKTGFVQYLEEQGRCTYAVTYGTFHGDNFNQATNLANAIRRVKSLVGSDKVDVVAWSKGVLPVDLYLSNVASWKDWGPKHFERVAADEAKNVPAFRKDIRTYIALSGPHLGIDLNFRHPYNDLIIFSTDEAAPIGQGPVVWGWMSAVQCVNFGYGSADPNSPFYNQNALSVCGARGGQWPDYWNRIYASNIASLDAEGKPVAPKSLQDLNVTNGVKQADFSFDKYNIAMWGSTNDQGKYVSAYLGQMQTAYDLRTQYPLPDRESPPLSNYDWTSLDLDENKWRTWLASYKLFYNVGPVVGGWVEDDAAHRTCRDTAFDPLKSPCKAKHVSYDVAHAEAYAGGYATYTLMDGIGINAVMEMGGNMIERLKHHGLSPDLDQLYVLHGTKPGDPSLTFEYDGLQCPTCDPKGDGVLFDVSIAALDQLTQGWTTDAKTNRAKQEGVPNGHLEVGVEPTVWAKMLAEFNK